MKKEKERKKNCGQKMEVPLHLQSTAKGTEPPKGSTGAL